MSKATPELCAFVHTTSLASIPEEVRIQAKRTLVNFFGCAFGGARHESVEAAIRGLGPWSGRQVARVLGRSEVFDLALAALLNGMSSAVYSFDDPHAQALVHPGGPVASALLALSQSHAVTGEEFLVSFIVGAEIACRLSKSISVAPAKLLPSWVQTGVCAGIGAASGAARLIGLTEKENQSTISLSAARASGLRALSQSMCFAFMAGTAAQTGVTSALLDQAGMKGPEEPLTSKYGFCESFSVEPHIDYLTCDLGARFEFQDNTIKPYPCGVVIHPAIEAALALAPRISDPKDIREIVMRVNPATKRLSDKFDPVDQYEAQTSMQHWVACAILDRAAGIAQSQPDRLKDPSVTVLRRLVRLEGDERIGRSGVEAQIHLCSGAVVSADVSECKGSLKRPMTDLELDEKYMIQATPVLGEAAARRVARKCWNVETLSSAAGLLID